MIVCARLRPGSPQTFQFQGLEPDSPCPGVVVVVVIGRCRRSLSSVIVVFVVVVVVVVVDDDDVVVVVVDDDDDDDAAFLRIENGFMTVFCLTCPRYMVFISKIPEAVGKGNHDTWDRNEAAQQRYATQFGLSKKGIYMEMPQK